MENAHRAAGPEERTLRRSLRTALALASALILLSTAAAGLWYEDWRYGLPAPRPADLVQPPLGTVVGALVPRAELVPDERPLFLHFTSSDCPCSRFAVDHVRELVRAFGDRVRFVAVEEGTEGDSHAELGIDALADPGGALAAHVGVYATPQAVIVAPDGTLWYRGNYNAARYCADPATAYARRALEALLRGEASAATPVQATVAYGCALPAWNGR